MIYGIPGKVKNHTATIAEINEYFENINTRLAMADEPDYKNFKGAVILAISDLADMVQSLVLASNNGVNTDAQGAAS